MSHLNKKSLGTGAALVALSAFVPNPFMIGEALAQATAQDTMNINANVANPLNVNEVTKLLFGFFAVSATAGTLTFNPAGTTINNGVVVTAGTVGKVSFSAPQNATFSVSISDFVGGNAITLSTAVGGASSKTLKVTAITMDATAKMTFDPGGVGVPDNTEQFKTGKTVESAKINDALGVGIAAIGGILHFKPNNVVGLYTGTYTLSTTF